MTPVFKEKDQFDAENYRLVSILLILFKVHEGVLKFSQNNNVEFAKVLVHNIVFLQRLKNGVSLSKG